VKLSKSESFHGLVLAVVLALTGCGGGSGAGSGGAAMASGGGVTTSGAAGGSTSGGSGGTVGGTPFEFDTGIGGSGGIIGEIDDFGSIIINGLEMNTDTAEFFVEGQSGGVQADLRVGQHVVIAGDLGTQTATSVHYRSNLQGPVSAPPVAVDADTGRYQLVVLGQTVITSASTRFDGVLAEDVREGDLVEVSGPVDADGRVRAAYVRLLPLLDTFKATGRVSNLDTMSRTFDLAGLHVSYDGAEFVRFAEPALSEGQLVEVRMPTGGFTLPADAMVTEVERLPVPRLGDGAELEVEGLIDNFDSSLAFTVSGLPVTTTTLTTYTNGSADQLGLNAEVEVIGTVDDTGTVIADEIEFKRTSAIRVEGPVSTIDAGLGTVTAFGVSFIVRDGTRLADRRDAVDPFSLADLMPGDFVRARGYLEGTQVIAVEVTRTVPNPGNGRTVLRGPVTGYDKAASTVAVQNVSILDGIGSTVYQDQNQQPVDRDTFYDLLLPDAGGLNVIWSDLGSPADPADRLTLQD